ncbi:ComEC/Rec2 family competence protein [Namhaeicola litoreus]|uniref:ComEC/Rec2 family competence protein n=1 Tax=Namhaeicola litoreus TaxID=1052145 RepID=A0ABW3Y0R6_9FLAO
MVRFDYIPTWLSLFLILGILCGKEFNLSSSTLFFSSLGLIIGLGFFLFRSHRKIGRNNFFLLFSALTFFIIGVNSYFIHQIVNQKAHYKNHVTDSSAILLEIEKELKPSQNNHKYIAIVRQIDQTAVRGKVVLFVPKKEFSLAPGDRLLTKTTLVPIHTALNPNDFDYRKYMQNEQISEQIFISENNSIELSPNKNLGRSAFLMREKISNSLLINDFQASLLPLVQTLFLGQKQDLSSDVFDEFRRAGVVHILAISGLHISILIGFLFLVFQPITKFKKGMTIRLMLVLFVLWLYVFLVGYSASVVRAATMFTAISIGLYSKKKINVQSALIASMFILLLLNPNYLWQVGFQMSYLAVFFIVGFYPLLRVKTNYKVINYFLTLLWVTIIAQTGVLPLSLYYFHQTSPLFLISGILILPFIGMLLGIGFITIFLSIFDLAPILLVKIFSMTINIFYKSVHFISTLNTFEIEPIYFSKLSVFLLYLILFSLFAFLKHKNQLSIYLTLCFIILLQFHFIHQKWMTQRKNQFVLFHQYKESILLDQKGQKVKIFETHPNRENPSSVQYFLEANRIKEIEKRGLKPAVLEFEQQCLLIVSQDFHFREVNVKPNFLLMCNSPKVNFDRMLDHFQPKMILVDGSNYPDLVKKWQKTAMSKDIIFHYTGADGAFVYSH